MAAPNEGSLPKQGLRKMQKSSHNQWKIQTGRVKRVDHITRNRKREQASAAHCGKYPRPHLTNFTSNDRSKHPKGK